MASKIAKRDTARPTIKTPQELVHIKHKISLRQYKYWLLMLRAYREAYELGDAVTDKGFHRIQMTTIKEWLGYEPVKAELREDLRAIRREEIIYNALSKDGKEVQRGAGFISEWELSSNWIGFKLPDFLRESIEQLDIKGSIFQALNWQVFNSFTGKYEAIIYKLCKDYVGVRRTPVMSLQDFREYMGLKPTEYPEFKDFNKFIITLPIAKINASEVSDITVEVAFTRQMRKVATIQFLVTPKQQTMLDLGDDPAFRLAQIPVSLVDQRKYLAQFSAEEIQASIDRANQYAAEQEKQGKTINLGAIYRTAIEGQWGKEQEALRSLKAEKATKVEAKKAAEQDAIRSEEDQIRRDREEANRLWLQFLELDEITQVAHINKLIGDNDTLRQYYSKYGKETQAVRSLVVKAIRARSLQLNVA